VGTGGFEEEPATALGLIDPVFEEGGGGYISGVVTDIMCCAHGEGESLLIFVEFREHVLGATKSALLSGMR
jgi:hypothetical protein